MAYLQLGAISKVAVAKPVAISTMVSHPQAVVAMPPHMPIIQSVIRIKNAADKRKAGDAAMRRLREVIATPNATMTIIMVGGEKMVVVWESPYDPFPVK